MCIRDSTYGVANQIPVRMNNLFTHSAGNPQEVADAVLSVIETPAGQKEIRYRVSAYDLGVDDINIVSARVQSQMINGFGLTDETTFTQQKAAAL